MFKVNVMFIIYTTKIGIFYQIRKFLQVFFFKNESFFQEKALT